MMIYDKYNDGIDIEALPGDSSVSLECFEAVFNSRRYVTLEFNKEQALELRKALDKFIEGEGI